MNKELLANIRNILIPTLASRLKKTNFEGQGEKDAIEFTHDITEIFDLAEQQLSAQQWIPSYAGENVPEVGEAVLVTFKNSDGEADVFIARWGGNFYDCGYYCLSVSEVMAFMPLPKPYREGEK